MKISSKNTFYNVFSYFIYSGKTIVDLNFLSLDLVSENANFLYVNTTNLLSGILRIELLIYILYLENKL